MVLMAPPWNLSPGCGLWPPQPGHSDVVSPGLPPQPTLRLPGKRIELGHRSLAPATFLKVRFAGLFETWTPPADYCNHTTCERTHRAVNPRGTRAAAPFLARRIRGPFRSGMCAASLASPLAPPPSPFSPACAGLPKTIAKPRTLSSRGERGPEPRAKDESPRCASQWRATGCHRMAMTDVVPLLSVFRAPVSPVCPSRARLELTTK